MKTVALAGSSETSSGNLGVLGEFFKDSIRDQKVRGLWIACFVRFLSIPASSASVERLFSTCGAIIRARRASLSARTVEALLLRMQSNADHC